MVTSEACLLTWSHYGVIKPRPLQLLLCSFLPEQNLHSMPGHGLLCMWCASRWVMVVLGQAVTSEYVQTTTACLQAPGEEVRWKFACHGCHMLQDNLCMMNGIGECLREPGACLLQVSAWHIYSICGLENIVYAQTKISFVHTQYCAD